VCVQGVGEAKQLRTVVEEFPRVKSGDAKLARVVTLVDSNDFLNHYRTGETLQERPDLTGETEEASRRLLVDLMVEQIESSDVVLLNKMDLLQDRLHEAQLLASIVQKLNPSAPLHEVSFGMIDLLSLEEGGRPTEHSCSKCTGGCCSKSHKQRYGIDSFVFQSNTPFHGPSLAKNVLQKMAAVQQNANLDIFDGLDDEEKGECEQENPFRNVIRSKGFLWLASQSSKKMYWSHAGKHFSVMPQGGWDEKIPAQQQLVFIGINMNKEQITNLLETCLVQEN